MWRAVLGVLLLVSPATAYPEPIEMKANICGSCHGANGLPTEKTVPIIWGQNAGYLYLQLRDFQKGARKNPAMSVVAHDVVREDALEFAEYFAAKQWPRNDAPWLRRSMSRHQRRWTGRFPARHATSTSSRGIHPCRGWRASSATIWSRR